MISITFLKIFLEKRRKGILYLYDILFDLIYVDFDRKCYMYIINKHIFLIKRSFFLYISSN